jgi:xanthine dehydrogenase iron-sulfur cluster and FAD-binding subunit A
MWKAYIQPVSVEETLVSLNRHRTDARIINGGTDLVLELERNIRQPVVLIDISRVQGLGDIRHENGWIHIGANVTHNQVAGSSMLRQYAYPLVRACWEVGAPQIRNRGTVAGNVLTATPANDTIPSLIALGAHVTLKSVAHGERTLPLEEFIRGVRKTTLESDELLIEISFPALKGNERSTFIKFGLRQAQAISVVNVALILGFDGDRVTRARITLGSVAPTIVFAAEAQEYLQGQVLDEAVISKAADLAILAAKPIDDIRGSAKYRLELVRTLVKRALRQIWRRTELDGFPLKPVMLWGKNNGNSFSLDDNWDSGISDVIDSTINGKRCRIQGASHKTLLRMLREDIGLTGTKEGCAEGECGACTIFLDGIAVMSCLVPAPRAHGAEIVTIEGLGKGEELHPIQQAFIDSGAVQCGYCSPGFLMSSAKLLEEVPSPSRLEIQQAIAGNLCRCTGYYKIIEAIEHAATTYTASD